MPGSPYQSVYGKPVVEWWVQELDDLWANGGTATLNQRRAAKIAVNRERNKKQISSAQGETRTTEGAIKHLKQLGYSVYPPEPPRQPPGANSHYRDRVANWAQRNYGWTGGSNPEALLTETEKTLCWTEARQDAEFDKTKAIFGGKG